MGRTEVHVKKIRKHSFRSVSTSGMDSEHIDIISLSMK